jgi:hypothetical protein
VHHLDVVGLLDLGGGGFDADPEGVVVGGLLHHRRCGSGTGWISPAATNTNKNRGRYQCWGETESREGEEPGSERERGAHLGGFEKLLEGSRGGRRRGDLGKFRSANSCGVGWWWELGG